ncbi:LOW QUALITY PROTEIN: calpain-7-like [Uloborus diversus]|uniref:LOW QUALITY PROTEIN: calpain-7-like n=1 Tax=Uloborus diversus TaxID=327109 RepID=UPI0024094F47|nr:LOW QUALITY PROTEIN: calpain-7-like [Uloborus diversus]
MNEDTKKAESEAVEFATRAIGFDQQQNYDAAIYYYRVAAQALNSAYLQGSQIAGLLEKANEYLHRAEDIQKLKAQASEKVPVKNEQKLELERAEFLLRQGLEDDEAGNVEAAVELYLQAAELCLKARKFTQDSGLKEKLSSLAENALDRAEVLKQRNGSLNKSEVAPESPKSPTVPSMSSLHISDVPSQRQTLVHQRPSSPKPLQSTGKGNYTKEEIAVLRVTSLINGREYVPFMPVDLKERFAYPLPFSDKDGKLALSPKQKIDFSRWVRPEDISSRPMLIEVIDCFSIKQTIVSDCSFIASLAVSALYEKRFRKKVITKNIYPQNKAGEPVYNPCGKYMFKIHINGVRRKVIIDDYLPAGSHGELLCSYSNNRNEFWISLLEKAYMKIMGGYDFPGSNSNIDLHALTGWIPERISIDTSDPTFAKDKIFNMLLTKHNKGDVLITVATGVMGQAEADRAGLVPTHAYALLDIKEVLGKKLCLLKNPWSHLRWKGRFSEHDTKNWTPQLKDALKYDPRNAQMFDNGVFWIDYDSLLHFYNVIYLNWNPELFKYTYCLHQCWKAGSGPIKDIYNIGENPQFCLDIKSGGSAVWVLLTRHIVDRDDFAENKEFIALLVYKNGGRKVYMPNEPEPYIDGVRINSPHYLCKILVPQGGTTRYTLVMSQYEKSNTIYYTIRAYSTCPFTLTNIQNVFKYKQEIKNGEWTHETAGGCGNHSSYNKNPIYQVSLQSTCDDNTLLIDLKGPKQYHVGFDIVTVTVNNSSSPGYFSRKSSGSFRSGFTILEIADVPVGVYNIIPSTYSPGQKGPFFLTVQASCPIKVSRLK